GGRTYTVAMNMGALARLATVLGVKTFNDLQARLVELPSMPAVVAAILEANGHQVDQKAIDAMDPLDYFNRVLPVVFRKSDEEGDIPREAKENGANPPKRQAKKLTAA